MTMQRFPYQTDDKNKNMEDALKEAHKGVLEMQKNPSLFEFCLNPQNSFVRRQQHVVIAEGGFETESRGNARERHVCILRKNNWPIFYSSLRQEINVHFCTYKIYIYFY